MIPQYWDEAKKRLAEQDPLLAGLFAQYPGITLQSRQDPFFTLARSIVGQQISVKAAESVWQRLVAACGAIEPAKLLQMEAATMRSCGLSERKVDYLQALAEDFQQGRINSADWESLADEELISLLCTIRGIGRWTAEMFLIFHLQRPDVLPLDDIGLQRAIRLLYQDEHMNKSRMKTLAKNWQPWRSVATWYLWRSLDPVPVEY